MNGASADPCANTSSVPTINMTRTTGASHHFLRSFMKLQSSTTRLIASSLELSLQVAGTLSLGTRLPISALARCVRHGITAERPSQNTDRCQHEQVHRAHHDRCGHLGDGKRHLHPAALDRAEIRRNHQAE